MLKIIALIITLAYLFWPIDLIPDVVPILGWLDDVGIVGACIAYLTKG